MKYTTPNCSHRLPNAFSARNPKDGVCSLCGGKPVVLDLYPLTKEEKLKFKSK